MGERGGGVLKNRYNIINVGLIGHASSEDTKLLQGPGAYFPENLLKFEVLKLLEMHSKCQSYHHHVILYYFKSFTIPSGGPFWFLGEGGRQEHLPRAPHCLRTWTICHYYVAREIGSSR